jgi:hypothetical protein
MNKNDIMSILINQYGLSYEKAVQMVERTDAAEIIGYMDIAYRKGRDSILQSYNYNGGL